MPFRDERRTLLRLGGVGAALAAAAVLEPHRAAAAADPQSLLRTVLSRGHLIVGTGSTNPPWHFENGEGQLVGMDIAMAHILAQGLFDDMKKIKFVQQDPAARIPNIVTGKVDVVIQFMTVWPARAQLVNFSRPYYIEGSALLTAPKSKWQTYQALKAASKQVRASVLQNVNADALVHAALPGAHVMQLDTQANVIEAVEAGRADVAVVDASTVRWLVTRHPHAYTDPGYSYGALLYSAAVRQGDFDWLHWINTCFDVAMYGSMHANLPQIYPAAFEEFFGEKPPTQKPGFPLF